MCTLDLQDKNVNTYINFAYNQLFGKENTKVSDFDPVNLLKEDFQRFNNFRDRYSVMETAKNEGIAEGRAEGEAIGIQKGALQEKTSIAMQMKKDGMPIEMIAKYSGLSIEQIKEI